MLSTCSELGIRVPDEASLVFCEMSDGLPFSRDIARWGPVSRLETVRTDRGIVGLVGGAMIGQSFEPDCVIVGSLGCSTTSSQPQVLDRNVQKINNQ